MQYQSWGRGIITGCIILWFAAGGAALAAGQHISLTLDGASLYATHHGIENERLIPVANSNVVLATWDERGADGTLQPWAGVSTDGQTFARVTQADYTLGLRYGHFDPLTNIPPVPTALAAGDDIHLYIVQFWTQPLPEFRRDIEAAGGSVRHYVAQWAFLVEMTAAERAKVAALPYVRWIGPWQPAYRLEEYMLQHLADAATAYPSQHYNIQVLTEAEKASVDARIPAIGGRIEKLDAGKHLVEATLTPDQLYQVARWDEVLWVDRWSPLEPDMDIVRQLDGADYLETVAGFNGTGVHGEVFDEGFNLSHLDFQHHPLIAHGTVGSASHGASTSGICFGTGTGVANARGLLPEGQGVVCDYNFSGGIEGPSRRARAQELLGPPYYCVFQTSSVGSALTTQYTSISADTDDFLFDFDELFCQSQSNAGSQQSRPQAWAKNIVSGGAVNHYNTLTTSDDAWVHTASIGPASDGRIKPTLCGVYDWIWTTDCCATTSYTQTFGGTSGATPIIAGHFGLFFEMWAQGIFGNTVDPLGTVFDNRPHASTARAMLINTAEQYPFTGTTTDLTRVHQGWGRPNMQNLYDLRNNMFIVDETDLLQQFDSKTYAVNVDAGTPALKMTMVYTDPAGDPAVQTQHRINDLTLEAFSPTGTHYFGNYGLLQGNWSIPSNFGADHKDTEENIFVQNPTPGVWQVRVKAEEIIQDGHVETPELDADYGLVVSGVSGEVTGVHATLLTPKTLAFRVQGIRPSSPDAVLSFDLAEASTVRLTLHDVLGRHVTTLYNGAMGEGPQTLKWNGRDANGTRVAPGVYYARLEVGHASATGKLVVVR